MTREKFLDWAREATSGSVLPSEEDGHDLAHAEEILANRGLKLCWCRGGDAHVLFLSEDGVDRT